MISRPVRPLVVMSCECGCLEGCARRRDRRSPLAISLDRRILVQAQCGAGGLAPLACLGQRHLGKLAEGQHLLVAAEMEPEAHA